MYLLLLTIMSDDYDDIGLKYHVIKGLYRYRTLVFNSNYYSVIVFFSRPRPIRP